MECPADIRQMIEGLARIWDERYDDWDISVNVDGYRVVWWAAGGIGYTPSMDPNHHGKEELDVGDHYIISKDDLRRLIREPGYLPPLIAPMTDEDRYGRSEEVDDSDDCEDCGEDRDDCVCRDDDDDGDDD